LIVNVAVPAGTVITTGDQPPAAPGRKAAHETPVPETAPQL
jgi:hypothetical protein